MFQSDVNPLLREILLIEDEASDAFLTERALRRRGLLNPIRVIRDGEVAWDFLRRCHLAVLQEASPIIVLLDLRLPRCSGLEILAAMKSQTEKVEIPVIALLSNIPGRDFNEVQDLGADGCLVKPVSAAEFLSVTKKLEITGLVFAEPLTPTVSAPLPIA